MCRGTSRGRLLGFVFGLPFPPIPMWQRLWQTLQKRKVVDDPVAELPVTSTLAGGKFIVQMRVLERSCGHSELLADVQRTDFDPGWVILLDQEDLHALCGVLLASLHETERHVASQM